MKKYDFMSFGEPNIRFTPPDHDRLGQGDTLQLGIAAAELNCCVNISNMSVERLIPRLRTAYITKLVDNWTGQYIVNRAQMYGVDMSNVVVEPFDNIGRTRNGLAFVEVGIGPRPSYQIYDRGHTAVSKIAPGEIDWKRVLDTRWFHTTGIVAALGEHTGDEVVAALKAAKENGAYTSYDLNYRSTLWDIEEARKVAEAAMPYVDVLFGIEAGAVLGIHNEEGEDSFYCVRESRYQKDGQEYWYNVILGIDQNNANMSMVVAFQDISEHKQAANTIEQLRFQSEMDGLTKILNRATIEQHIKRYLDHEPKVPCAVALLDLDNFKPVNDVMGHSKGDFVLIETAEKLKQICRKTDEVGRLGGDEFMVFLKDVSQDQIYELAARMVNGLRMDVETQDGTITVTVSVGVACYPQDGKTFTELYCNADHALYTSKHAGKGQFTIYGQR